MESPFPAPAPASASAALVRGLLAGEAWAERQLLERYTAQVERVVARITGDTSADLDDRVQDAFVRVLERVHALRDPECLPGFVTQIAVFVGREALRSRRRRRWLRFFAPDEMPEAPAPVASEETRGALAAFQGLLDDLAPDDRVAFVLRHVDGMELSEVAHACDVSLATAKRRLARAHHAFREGARHVPDLEPWLTRGAWAKAK